MSRLNQDQLDEGLRALASESEQGAQRLPLARRSDIIHAARRASLDALATKGGRTSGAWLWLGAPSRIPAFATLVAAFLIVGFAYLRTTVPVQDPALRAAVPAGPSDVRVSQNGGEIVLEWSGADNKDAYVVRQAASPKQVYTSPGVAVRGTQFVDRSSSESAVTYYVVD
jgi:hypothetical protein